MDSLLASSSPAEVLHRYLSTRAVTNQAKTNTTAYAKIGFGQCGLIFNDLYHGAVLKIARPYFTDGLWNDALVHARVHRAVAQQHDFACCVPVPYSFVASTNESWWRRHRKRFSVSMTVGFPLPTAVLISQRIPPLPAPVRTALIEMYCPPSLQEASKTSTANRDCLARVYLGRKRRVGAPLPPNFSLRNYNLCLDQMRVLNLPTTLFARSMAEALAVMHWSAFIDGYDVEFVLGGEAAFDYRQHNLLQHTSDELEQLASNTDLDAQLRHHVTDEAPVRMWLLDFNLCSRWSEELVVKFPAQILSQMVLAFFENDPYYPLPLMEAADDQELWSAFQQTYLDKADVLLCQGSNYEMLKDLPARFIDGCIARERQKLADGHGHGHRDLKG